VEEVRGQEPGRLGSEERAPLGVYPARRRPQGVGKVAVSGR
jgi:hypothetical protein